MTQCFNCSSSQGRKGWYSFPVDVRRLSHLDRFDVKAGHLTRMLCKDCAKALNAQPVSNPHVRAVR
jgi:hypothetical protein